MFCFVLLDIFVFLLLSFHFFHCISQILTGKTTQIHWHLRVCMDGWLFKQVAKSDRRKRRIIFTQRQKTRSPLPIVLRSRRKKIENWYITLNYFYPIQMNSIKCLEREISVLVFPKKFTRFFFSQSHTLDQLFRGGVSFFACDFLGFLFIKHWY